MRNVAKLFMILMLAVAFAGCGDDDSSSDSANSNGATTADTAGGTGATTADTTGMETSGGDTGVTSGGETGMTSGGETGACAGDPGEPYGTSEGSNFLPFTFTDCAGNPYSFYGEDEGYCDTSFTVLSIAGGWCGPCRIEAELMQDNLVEAYAEQGVRVIVAIIQDNDFGVPDGDFCDGWAEQYGLTNPVLLDTLQETNVYFPGGALPATLIVDSNGVIVHREYGVSDNLETVTATLDQMLAEPE